MTVFFAGFLMFGVCAVLIWAALRRVFQAGRSTEKAQAEKGKHDNAQQALAVRDRLRRDADYARRLRARFTRK